MHNRTSAGVRLAFAAALLLLVAAPLFAVQSYSPDRLSVQGRVTSIVQQGDQYQVTLNHGGYTYYVPISAVGSRGLRVGDQVRLSGMVNGDLVNADAIAWNGDPYFTRDPNYTGVPFGSTGWLNGTIVSTNRHYHYVTVRDDATGNTYKVDVRHLDYRHPFNMNNVREGDHVSVNGSWENRDTFNAIRVEY